MTSKPSQDTNNSDNAIKQTVSNAEEKKMRDVVSPDTPETISDNDTDGHQKDVSGFDHDETPTSVIESSESEADRPLIVPDASTASKSDDDRSPGLDRDL